MYLSGTLDFVGRFFNENPIDRASVIFGNCVHVDDKELTARGSNVRKQHETRNIEMADYIIQPSSFWTRKTLDTVCTINEQYTYGFDWEWFIRAKRADVEFHPVDRFLSIYRFHDSHKTGTGRAERIEELTDLYASFHSPKIADVYLRWKLDRKIDLTRRFLHAVGVGIITDPVKVLYYIYFRKSVSLAALDDIREMWTVVVKYKIRVEMVNTFYSEKDV